MTLTDEERARLCLYYNELVRTMYSLGGVATVVPWDMDETRRPRELPWLRPCQPKNLLFKLIKM